jgi:hypothetical protein
MISRYITMQNNNFEIESKYIYCCRTRRLSSAWE